nr:PAS domain-containing protein [Actinacidiphila bryophytorum]
MSSRPSRGAARLASILDALPDALLLVDVNGTVVNANAIALETFESPGTALVGRGLLDLLPSFDSKRIPGSMRSPREAAEDTRTKPTRMVARRTDGTDFPVEVTSANLENGRTPYADYGDGVPHYTGDELLMLVVRDLTGTMDTEAELARQQRQTEMILRAAAEGVVGVDTAGKVVLVNPSAAQILGYRATDLGGKELHPLVHHSRPDGSALAYEETPLADTLRSGRKHRVRGQVLWRKDGRPVPVDLTTAPVRDGDQLVGAVMTFTDRTAYDALAARSGQLSALLDTSLRGPLAELRGELTGLAADPAGQLWPEANQILHHLAAGYARITTLIDNVLAFQRLDRGEDKLRREDVGLDQVIAAAVEGATELIGPGRAQFAVHAPPIQAAVDGERMAQALAHLVADVAGVDSAGNAIAYTGDSTIVVAAALRGDVIRIDVRGPHAGGDPVHLPLARGIVERHGGVLQTHEVPGQGSAYVLEVPAGKGNGNGGVQQAAAAQQDGGTRAAARSAATGDGDQPRESDTTVMPLPSEPARGTQGQAPAAEGQAPQDGAPTGRRRALRRPEGRPAPVEAAPAPVQPTGRRRAARTEEAQGQPQELDPAPDRAELPAAPIPNALPPAAPDATPETGRRAARRPVEPPPHRCRRSRSPHRSPGPTRGSRSRRPHRPGPTRPRRPPPRPSPSFRSRTSRSRSRRPSPRRPRRRHSAQRPATRDQLARGPGHPPGPRGTPAASTARARGPAAGSRGLRAAGPAAARPVAQHQYVRQGHKRPHPRPGRAVRAQAPRFAGPAEPDAGGRGAQPAGPARAGRGGRLRAPPPAQPGPGSRRQRAVEPQPHPAGAEPAARPRRRDAGPPAPAGGPGQRAVAGEPPEPARPAEPP